MTDKPRLTTSAGAPVPSNNTSKSAGERGPLLLTDYQLLEKLAHQNRERIPERHPRYQSVFVCQNILPDW